MLMAMVTKPASNVAIDSAPGAAPRPLAGPWNWASTALMHSIGDHGEPVADADLMGVDEHCDPPSLKPHNRGTPHSSSITRSVFSAGATGLLVADTVRQVSTVPQGATVEP